MKKIIIFVASLAMASSAYAQSEEEDYTVVLPEAAQKCVLPAAPDAIPPEADYDQLVAAKGQIAEFQKVVEVYRACLKEAEDSDELTAGNKQALVASFNYSVDMEERIAARFNDAIRDYKARQADE